MSRKDSGAEEGLEETFLTTSKKIGQTRKWKCTFGTSISFGHTRTRYRSPRCPDACRDTGKTQRRGRTDYEGRNPSSSRGSSASKGQGGRKPSPIRPRYDQDTPPRSSTPVRPMETEKPEWAKTQQRLEDGGFEFKTPQSKLPAQVLHHFWERLSVPCQLKASRSVG